MDKQEAKKILMVYRDDLAEDDCPGLADALLMAETDPELQACLKQEQAFDRAFADKLKAINPPADLLDKILQETPNPSGQANHATKVVWWRQSTLWMAAACIVGLVVLGVIFARPQPDNPLSAPQLATASPSQFNLFVESVADHAARKDRMQYRSNDRDDIYTFLAKNEVSMPQHLPEGLSHLKKMGCLAYTWNGTHVGVICFKGDKLYHLYVADAHQLEIDPHHSMPEYSQFGQFATASWTENSSIYVLTVEGKTEELGPFL